MLHCLGFNLCKKLKLLMLGYNQRIILFKVLNLFHFVPPRGFKFIIKILETDIHFTLTRHWCLFLFILYTFLSSFHLQQQCDKHWSMKDEAIFNLLKLLVMAERVGFEPTIRLLIYTLSKRAP
jgi:hypothetical protein